MEKEYEDKIEENHQMSIQILRNQKHLLQQRQVKPDDMENPQILIDQTNDTLRLVER